MEVKVEKSKEQQFIEELYDLLVKYNAEISINLDGDTHGLDSWISVDFREGQSFRYKNVMEVNELDQYTLKEHLQKKF